MSATGPILHQYAGSPFSEKVRLVFGLKGLAWRAVEVPVMLPKPDVVALTGGYRRAPVLQIGADIWCDSALICRVVDRLAPQPPLFPASAGPVQHVLAQWADSALFWTAVPLTVQTGAAQLFAGAPAGFMQAFRDDRAAMTTGMRRPTPADATAQLHQYLGWLDTSLADGRACLLGADACVADFAVAQSVWFMRRAPMASDRLLAPYGRLVAWYERLAAFGHGQVQRLDSADALASAAAATSHAEREVDASGGLASGADVIVTPTDYAFDMVAGRLVGLDDESVSIERDDARAGTLHVHFPRIGYQVRAAPAAA